MLIVLGLAYYYLSPYFSLKIIQENQGVLNAFVSQHKVLSYVLFVSVFVLTTSLALPTMTILTLLCGFLFDMPEAFIVISISFIVHTALMTALVRYVFRDLVEKYFAKLVLKINKNIRSKGYYYVVFLRLTVILPPWLINCAIALTALPLLQFVFISWISMIPILFTLLSAGRLLNEIQSVSDIFDLKFALIMAGLLVLSMGALLFSRGKDLDS